MTKIEYDFQQNRIWDTCWIEWMKIKINSDKNEIRILSNTEWLIWLWTLLLEMAKKQGNDHIHLDQYNSLEEWSAEVIIEKDENY